MTKAELIEQLYLKNTQFSLKEVDRMVKEVFDYLSAHLASGDRIEIRGFGSFSLHHHQPREGRNPRTGKEMPLQAKSVPHFKVGKSLKDRLNASL